MKKIIAISVMFVLLTGAVFAVDLGGTVFGRINVLEGDTGKKDDGSGDSNPVTAGGGMERVRVDGAGEAGDGAFGGYVRLQQNTKKYFEPVTWNASGVNETSADFVVIDSAYAWWKPLDQFKLIIGSNSDGFWSKEGVAGWGFNQIAYDNGVAINPGIWCGNGWGSSVYAGDIPYLHTRYVFFEGLQYYGAALEITPSDIASINIGLPFISAPRGNEAADQFRAAVFQLNLNFDFGGIAITYDGASRPGQAAGDAGTIFASFDGTFGDLGLLVGLSYHLAGAADEKKPQWGDNDKALPLGVGLGVKYVTDSFGVKFRVTAALAGDKEGNAGDTTFINASVLPFFNLSDSMTAFIHAGLGMAMGDAVKAQYDKNITGWYFNPYLRVGAEWGPTFYAGIQVSTNGIPDAEDKTTIKWAVPISLVVSF